MWLVRGAVRAVLVCVAFFVGITLVKRFVYFDTIIPEVYPCLLHGWTENEDAGRKVWDAVPFGGELDVLEARLQELHAVVDKFVIVESPRTFTGQQKPLYFKEHRARFEKFLPKIVYVQLEDVSPQDIKGEERQMEWRKEQQKTGILQGLSEARDNDLVIVSDVDEIPRAVVVKQLALCAGYTLPVELHMAAYMYDFACPMTSLWFTPSRRAKVVLRKQLTSICDGAWDGHACIDELQANQNLGLSLFYQPTSVINAGWHLANFLPAATIAENEKSRSLSHKPPSAEEVECMIFKCREPTGVAYGVRTKSYGDGPAWVHARATASDPVYVKFYLRPLKKC